ncbi:MAG: heavy metal translocating P-type ATPase [Thermoleophilia bacterium]|nr:heavy metal translocating P-type ATPase [Thermoleophilia bacterium]
MRDRLLAIIALAGIVAGSACHILDAESTAHAIWAVVIVVLLIPLTWEVITVLARGRIGVDAIALMAMVTALAMGEFLAGAVVGLMLSGGNALEGWAAGRSRRELRSLIERAPRIAHRYDADRIIEVAVESIDVGERIVVRSGEVVPVDGLLESDSATLDESALTGESLPVDHRRGGQIRSGTSNGGDAFDMRATRTAENSAYSSLVRLVRQAEENRAPFVRMADRYAAFLLPFTLLVGGGAWAVSGDSIRFLAVLVVATPCPLILAAPIAFIAGISRAASRGIVVKGGSAIEALGGARAVLLDKTGTLTLGTPEIDHILTVNSFNEDELLRLTASLDQLSAHVLAEALVHGVESRGVRLEIPSNVSESPGQGITGSVAGHSVIAGTAKLLADAGISGIDEADRRAERFNGDGHAKVYVAVDGELAGVLLLADKLREDAHEMTKKIHSYGIKHIAMVTGDNHATAREIADQVGIDDVYSRLAPEEKLAIVKRMQSDPETHPVVMVGDGINDAPALALADIGIAMGTAGATASAEAADAVITVNLIGRVADAIAIGRRSLHIASQSVIAGLAMSIVAMGFAAAGMIPPVAGALLQEGIDVAVILNALRALH